MTNGGRLACMGLLWVCACGPKTTGPSTSNTGSLDPASPVVAPPLLTVRPTTPVPGTDDTVSAVSFSLDPFDPQSRVYVYDMSSGDAGPPSASDQCADGGDTCPLTFTFWSEPGHTVRITHGPETWTLTVPGAAPIPQGTIELLPLDEVVAPPTTVTVVSETECAEGIDLNSFDETRTRVLQDETGRTLRVVHLCYQGSDAISVTHITPKDSDITYGLYAMETGVTASIVDPESGEPLRLCDQKRCAQKYVSTASAERWEQEYSERGNASVAASIRAFGEAVAPSE